MRGDDRLAYGQHLQKGAGAGAVDEEALRDHCRATVKTNWCPTGTAHIGHTNDPMTVLIPDAKGKGVDDLHVCRCILYADRTADLMMGKLERQSATIRTRD